MVVTGSGTALGSALHATVLGGEPSRLNRSLRNREVVNWVRGSQKARKVTWEGARRRWEDDW